MSFGETSFVICLHLVNNVLVFIVFTLLFSFSLSCVDGWMCQPLDASEHLLNKHPAGNWVSITSYSCITGLHEHLTHVLWGRTAAWKGFFSLTKGIRFT